jgi:hypothetical protein
MLRIWKALLVVCLALLTFAPTAAARGRGVVIAGGGFYSPYYGWYGPGWYSPWGFGGPYAYGYYPTANSGNVKIKTELKDASVFVDGGYAGQSGKLKKFALRPGTHDIALRDPSGHTFYQERINVLKGKTLEIHPDYTRH